MSEILVLSSVVLTVLIVAVAALRRYLPTGLIKFLERFGKREDSDMSND